MHIRLRLFQQPAREREKVGDVFLLGCNHVGVVLVDDIVEPKLKLCVLAKGAKCLGYRPFRV